MGLILLDGFEDLTSPTTVSSFTVVAGRNGNGAQGGIAASLVFNLSSAQESDTVTLGAAVRLNTPGANSELIGLRSDAGATQHVTLSISSSGLTLYRGSHGAVTIATYSFSWVNLSWYYFEIQAKVHDTTGTVTVRVNGTDVITYSGDTKNAGTKTVFDQVRLQGANATATVWDDFYLMTGVGDSFLGDIAVETLYPNGNGNANQWVGSDGNSTDNYLLVDEAGTPVTSDYTGSPTTGQQDLYALTNLVRTSGTVFGVCHQAFAAKSDSGAKQFKIVNRGATDTKTGALDLTTSYTPYHYMLATDPEGGAWTIANVNALQSGVEVV